MAASDSVDKSDISGVSTWDIPYVEDPNKKPEDTPTNALNKRSGWKYEPPEQEEEIRPPTAEEIEAIRQAAHEEGFSQGKEAGYQEGLQTGKEDGLQQGLDEGKKQGFEEGFETGKTEVDTLAQQWYELVEQLHSPLNKLNEEAKLQLTKLAVTLARSVIYTETKTNETVITTAIDKGVSALPMNESNIQILVNESDLEHIQSYYSASSIQDNGWEIVASPAITKGGCEVVTHNNAVDVSIEKRCRSVLDTFLLNNGLSDE